MLQNKLQEVPAYAYLENQFRRFQVTGEKECRGENDATHMASTYLCLLHSSRRHEVGLTLSNSSNSKFKKVTERVELKNQ